MDRGAWQAAVHSVTESRTQLKWLSTHTMCTYQSQSVSLSLLYPLNLWELLVNFIYFSKDFFFLCGPFVKVFIEFVTTLLLFYIWVFRLWGMWDLNSSTTGWTHTPWIGRRSLNHRTTREVPETISFKQKKFIVPQLWGTDKIKMPLRPHFLLGGSLPRLSQFLVTLGISWLVAGQICSCLHKLSSQCLYVQIPFSFLW